MSETETKRISRTVGKDERSLLFRDGKRNPSGGYFLSPKAPVSWSHSDTRHERNEHVQEFHLHVCVSVRPLFNAVCDVYHCVQTYRTPSFFAHHFEERKTPQQKRKSNNIRNNSGFKKESGQERLQTWKGSLTHAQSSLRPYSGNTKVRMLWN